MTTKENRLLHTLAAIVGQLLPAPRATLRLYRPNCRQPRRQSKILQFNKGA